MLSSLDIFGEEDIIEKRKRTFSIQCQTLGGVVMKVHKDEFYQQIYKDL